MKQAHQILNSVPVFVQMKGVLDQLKNLFEIYS